MTRVLALALLPWPAAAQDVATVSYTCDRGARIEATYLNTDQGSWAVVTVEGRQVAFAVAESASGARYLAVDPGLPYVWWTKGDTATLYAGETPLVENCAAS